MRSPDQIDVIKRGKPGVDALRQARGHEFGLRSAARLTPEQCSIRSSKCGNIVLQRYGSGYYSALGKLSAARNRVAREHSVNISDETVLQILMDFDTHSMNMAAIAEKYAQPESLISLIVRQIGRASCRE